MPEKRRDNIANKDIDYLLDPENSPLFFLELKNIITREWETFKNIFELEKTKVEVILDEINAGRFDAHAKFIQDDHFLQLVCILRNSKKFLKHGFEPRTLE